MFERREINEKEAEDGPFFLKKNRFSVSLWFPTLKSFSLPTSECYITSRGSPMLLCPLQGTVALLGWYLTQLERIQAPCCGQFSHLTQKSIWIISKAKFQWTFYLFVTCIPCAFCKVHILDDISNVLRTRDGGNQRNNECFEVRAHLV